MKSRSARGLGFASAGLMALALGCYEESSPLDLNAKATGPSEEFLKSKRDQPAPAQRPGGGGGGKGGKGGGKAGGKSAPLAATDTKSNRAIMQKVGKEPEALASKLGAALKAESPDWTPVQSSAKELALLAAALGKNDPTKGAQDSWTKLTGEFASLAATMEKNAAAKDKVGATTAHAALM
ncbi:MAG TPA: hypothetical protein VNC50_00560, partial [Planctomycetia bacterium]|nr:hypothetical protein [Planctomycetia bacterium]